MTHPPVKRMTSKLGFGEFLIAKDLRCVDEYPEILASRLPLWLEAELPRLRSLSKPQMRAEWTRRSRAMLEELRSRENAPERTIHG